MEEWEIYRKLRDKKEEIVRGAQIRAGNYVIYLISKWKCLNNAIYDILRENILSAGQWRVAGQVVSVVRKPGLEEGRHAWGYTLLPLPSSGPCILPSPWSGQPSGRFTLPHPQGALWVWVGLEVYAVKCWLAERWPVLPLPKASWVYWEESCWRVETASGLIGCLERNNKNNKT